MQLQDDVPLGPRSAPCATWGFPLESIRALLDAQTSLPEVAAAHLKVLDHQIQTLRLRRAVLRAAAKTNTTHEEVALMHRLATMSEVERQHLIDDFLDDTFGDTNANPELVAMLRAMRPELPDDPEPHQVEAWVELAELVRGPTLSGQCSPHGRVPGS